MKKLLFIGVMLILACNINSPEQKKAEALAKVYLDSLNHNSGNLEIINFERVYSIHNSLADDPNYEKFKYDPLKSDSIRKHFKPQITGWIIHVTFKGTDGYSNFGIHKYQCLIDKRLSKCVVGIEVGSSPSQ